MSAVAGGGAGCWTGGGVTGCTTGGVAGGVIGTAAAGGLGAGAATGAGVGAGGVGAGGVGVGVGAGGAFTGGGVCAGGAGFGGFFGAGATGVWVCPERTIGVPATRAPAPFAFVFRTPFGAWWLAGNSAAGTTTICGVTLSLPGAENGSMYGDVVGVRASDQRRADTPAHAATTTTAASRRTPTYTSLRTRRTTYPGRYILKL